MYAAHKLLARRFATNRAALSTPEMNLKKVLKRMGQTKLPPPGIKTKATHINIRWDKLKFRSVLTCSC